MVAIRHSHNCMAIMFQQAVLQEGMMKLMIEVAAEILLTHPRQRIRHRNSIAAVLHFNIRPATVAWSWKMVFLALLNCTPDFGVCEAPGPRLSEWSIPTANALHPKFSTGVQTDGRTCIFMELHTDTPDSPLSHDLSSKHFDCLPRSISASSELYLCTGRENELWHRRE